jgi:hypothetical protein
MENLKEKRVKVVIIGIREMAQDFVEPWLSMLASNGVDIAPDFLELGQQDFKEDHGYTSMETYYRLLKTEEDENDVRDTIKRLRKRNK